MAESSDRCSSCRRSLVDPVSGTVAIGIRIVVADQTTNEPSDQFTEAFQRIYPELPVPLDVMVCYVCWLRSLGVAVTERS